MSLPSEFPERRPPRGGRGHTLVEVLVVLVVIGVVGTLAVLRWRPEDPARALTDAAAEFGRLLRHQCESVLLDARDRGVLVDPAGYRLAAREGTRLVPGRERRAWPAGTSVQLLVDGLPAPLGDDDLVPGLRCTPDGAWPPFELRLDSTQGTRAVLVGHPDGTLETGS